MYDYPTSRDNKLLVVYSLDVQGQNPDGSWTRPPVTHNECKYYTITRCGDGVVDAGYESCDPAAPGYSPETCDINTCTPITVQPGNFDLSIKKYAKSEDVFASVDNTENFNYTIVVRNNGTGAVTGTTTVRDNLPPSVLLRATPSGNGWNCVNT